MTIKSERVAELIYNHLTQLLLTETRDPRLQGVSVTEVKLDREIEHANIFVNALGEEERRDEILGALDRAQGFLRSELASRLRLRRMPQLHFEWDYTLEHASHMDELLDSLHIDRSNTTDADQNLDVSTDE